MPPHCSDCRFQAEHFRCARVPLFVVPQPERRQCSRGKWRAPAEGEACPKCEGCGWMLSSYQAAGGPNFDICDECHNPDDRRCP